MIVFPFIYETKQRQRMSSSWFQLRPAAYLIVLYCLLETVTGQDVPTPVGKCDAGRMTVTIPTHAIPFKGAIHVRGFRSNVSR